MDARAALKTAVARRDALRPLLVPAAVGVGVTAVIGLLGGGWRAGAAVGGAATVFLGAFEYLDASRRELVKKGRG